MNIYQTFFVTDIKEQCTNNQEPWLPRFKKGSWSLTKILTQLTWACIPTPASSVNVSEQLPMVGVPSVSIVYICPDSPPPIILVVKVLLKNY